MKSQDPVFKYRITIWIDRTNKSVDILFTALDALLE